MAEAEWRILDPRGVPTRAHNFCICRLDVRHDSAYGGRHALHGARLRVCATSPKSPPRPRYAGAVTFIDRCHGCPYQGKAIGSRGNPASPIVLVGEAPGATEIVEGEPFRGLLAASLYGHEPAGDGRAEWGRRQRVAHGAMI